MTVQQQPPGSDREPRLTADHGVPSTMPPDEVEQFGSRTPLGRAGQPAELAPVSVLLASDDGSSVSGARVAVTGGTPIL